MLILISGSCGDQFQFTKAVHLKVQINRLVILFLLSLLLIHSSTLHRARSASISLSDLNEGGFLSR